MYCTKVVIVIVEQNLMCLKVRNNKISKLLESIESGDEIKEVWNSYKVVLVVQYKYIQIFSRRDYLAYHLKKDSFKILLTANLPWVLVALWVLMTVVTALLNNPN